MCDFLFIVVPRRPGGLQFVISVLGNVGVWYTQEEGAVRGEIREKLG